MAEELDELFDDPLDQPVSPAPTAPAPAPSPGYAPSVEGLAQELGQVKQILQTIVPVLMRGQPAASAPPPQPGPPPSADLSYKDQEYLDEQAATALLSSPNVRGELNNMLNKTARQVHASLAAEIVRDRQANEQFRTQSVQAYSRLETARQMQEDFNAFYGEHPDLQPHNELVMLEAQQMAREYQQNPYAYTGISREQLMHSLAERTQRRVAAIVASASGQPGGPPSRLPARRTQVERGSGTRIGPAPQPKDANERELQQFDNFMRR